MCDKCLSAQSPISHRHHCPIQCCKCIHLHHATCYPRPFTCPQIASMCLRLAASLPFPSQGALPKVLTPFFARVNRNALFHLTSLGFEYVCAPHVRQAGALALHFRAHIFV